MQIREVLGEDTSYNMVDLERLLFGELDVLYASPFDLEVTDNNSQEHRRQENGVERHTDEQEERGEVCSHRVHLSHQSEITQVDLQHRVECSRQVFELFDLTAEHDIG